MLKNLTDPNENILWQGKPHRFLYILGNPLIYPFALCWGLFDFFFITKFNAASFGLFPFANFLYFCTWRRYGTHYFLPFTVFSTGTA